MLFIRGIRQFRLAPEDRPVKRQPSHAEPASRRGVSGDYAAEGVLGGMEI
jgi:hypothetical protein